MFSLTGFEGARGIVGGGFRDEEARTGGTPAGAIEDIITRLMMMRLDAPVNVEWLVAGIIVPFGQALLELLTILFLCFC